MTFSTGDRVWIDRQAPRLIGPVTPIAADAATLCYRMTGTSDYWIVQLPSGAETVASESMMRKETA